MGMKARSLQLLRLFLVVMMGVMSSPRAHAEDPNASGVFEVRLSKALAVSKHYFATPGPEKEETRRFKSALKELDDFAAAFPESMFADDAVFVAGGISFYDALFSGDAQESEAVIRALEQAAQRLRGGGFEPLTIRTCEQIVGGYEAYAFVNVPYRWIIAYLKGWWGWQFKRYDVVAENYSKLKDAVDYTKDTAGYLAEDIYSALVESYIKLSRFDEARTVAAEAYNKFPDNRRLRRMMKPFITRTAPTPGH